MIYIWRQNVERVFGIDQRLKTDDVKQEHSINEIIEKGTFCIVYQRAPAKEQSIYGKNTIQQQADLFRNDRGQLKSVHTEDQKVFDAGLVRSGKGHLKQIHVSSALCFSAETYAPLSAYYLHISESNCAEL